MEGPFEWSTAPPWGWTEGVRWDLELEPEMQMWRWALLEAHLREASLVYERLMDSPLAPATREEAGRTTWDKAPGPSPMENREAVNPGGGRSQGRRQRRQWALAEQQWQSRRQFEATCVQILPSIFSLA